MQEHDQRFIRAAIEIARNSRNRGNDPLGAAQDRLQPTRLSGRFAGLVQPAVAALGEGTLPEPPRG